MAKVQILQTGYNRVHKDGKTFIADCTVSLITGENILTTLVDTSGPWNAEKLLKDLKAMDMEPKDINAVVCTHGHSDHVGNLNLFSHAKFIVGEDIFQSNVYENFNFREVGPQGKNRYYLTDSHSDSSPYIVSTPGHTCSDVSVVVSDPTKNEVTVIAGDIFENEYDINDPTIWQDNSSNIVQQQHSRDYILSIADWIIPGHGNKFPVTKEMKLPCIH